MLDEFALLLQLKDVYWAQQGRISVDIGVVVAAGLLLYYLGQCYWHDVVAELKRGFRANRAGREDRLMRSRREGEIRTPDLTVPNRAL